MAAEQAVELLEIDAAVVPTKTIPQGMAAILAFNPEAAVDVNKNNVRRICKCEDRSSYLCSA